MHLLFQTFFLFSVTEKKFTYRVGKETFKTTFSDRKVRFGTTVSISKNGRLASCSNLEWTSQMFDYNKKIPNAKNTTLWTIPRYQLGNLKWTSVLLEFLISTFSSSVSILTLASLDFA